MFLSKELVSGKVGNQVYCGRQPSNTSSVYGKVGILLTNGAEYVKVGTLL